VDNWLLFKLLRDNRLDTLLRKLLSLVLQRLLGNVLFKLLGGEVIRCLLLKLLRNNLLFLTNFKGLFRLLDSNRDGLPPVPVLIGLGLLDWKLLGNLRGLEFNLLLTLLLNGLLGQNGGKWERLVLDIDLSALPDHNSLAGGNENLSLDGHQRLLFFLGVLLAVLLRRLEHHNRLRLLTAEPVLLRLLLRLDPVRNVSGKSGDGDGTGGLVWLGVVNVLFLLLLSRVTRSEGMNLPLTLYDVHLDLLLGLLNNGLLVLSHVGGHLALRPRGDDRG